MPCALIAHTMLALTTSDVEPHQKVRCTRAQRRSNSGATCPKGFLPPRYAGLQKILFADPCWWSSWLSGEPDPSASRCASGADTTRVVAATRELVWHASSEPRVSGHVRIVLSSLRPGAGAKVCDLRGGLVPRRSCGRQALVGRLTGAPDAT